MKTAGRYAGAMLAVLCLLCAAMLTLFVCVTTAAFARMSYGDVQQRAGQQRINRAVEALTEKWNLSPELLLPWVVNAAERQSAAVADWWGDLWNTPSADPCMPLWLDGAQEAELVAQIRADAGFIALTDEHQRRALARDEVAYALDEAICDAVTPLRRSIVEMGITMLMEAVELPLIRQAAMISAVVCALLAAALMIPLKRTAGSILLSAGAGMFLLTLPVLLCDIPGMLSQLGDIALLLGQGILTAMGGLWLGMAVMLAAAGLLVISMKKGRAAACS